MFKNTTTWASFSVDDLEKAEEFYGTSLGIPLEEHMPGFMATIKFNRGSYNVSIFLRKHHVPAIFTILNFQVDDITKAMQELSRKASPSNSMMVRKMSLLMKEVSRRLAGSK
jgi:predicted enzyme related to lactoylglutathione lyase